MNKWMDGLRLVLRTTVDSICRKNSDDFTNISVSSPAQVDLRRWSQFRDLLVDHWLCAMQLQEITAVHVWSALEKMPYFSCHIRPSCSNVSKSGAESESRDLLHEPWTVLWEVMDDLVLFSSVDTHVVSAVQKPSVVLNVTSGDGWIPLMDESSWWMNPAPWFTKLFQTLSYGIPPFKLVICGTSVKDKTLPLSPITDLLGTIILQSHLFITTLHQLHLSNHQELVLRPFWVSFI